MGGPDASRNPFLAVDPFGASHEIPEEEEEEDEGRINANQTPLSMYGGSFAPLFHRFCKWK